MSKNEEVLISALDRLTFYKKVMRPKKNNKLQMEAQLVSLLTSVATYLRGILGSLTRLPIVALYLIRYLTAHPLCNCFTAKILRTKFQMLVHQSNKIVVICSVRAY